MLEGQDTGVTWLYYSPALVVANLVLSINPS